MKWLFIYRRNLVVCYVYIFLHFYITFKYDFHVDVERMIVKRKKSKQISASMVLKKMIAQYIFCRTELVIFVGYG